MGHNELEGLPTTLAANTRLKIVDLSGNPVRRLSDIQVWHRTSETSAGVH